MYVFLYLSDPDFEGNDDDDEDEDYNLPDLEHRGDCKAERTRKATRDDVPNSSFKRWGGGGGMLKLTVQ